MSRDDGRGSKLVGNGKEDSRQTLLIIYSNCLESRTRGLIASRPGLTPLRPFLGSAQGAAATHLFGYCHACDSLIFPNGVPYSATESDQNCWRRLPAKIPNGRDGSRLHMPEKSKARRASPIPPGNIVNNFTTE